MEAKARRLRLHEGELGHFTRSYASNLIGRAVCSLYSITTNQAAIIALFQRGDWLGIEQLSRPTPQPKGDGIARQELLLEHRRASRAQACPLPAQARGDGAGVGNFAGTEAVNVRGTGAALLSGALLRNSRSGEQRQQQAECATRTCPARKPCKRTRKPGLHDCVSLIPLAPLRRLC
jgi:hypothetical protein